jgi:hypothetical protein
VTDTDENTARELTKSAWALPKDVIVVVDGVRGRVVVVVVGGRSTRTMMDLIHRERE